MLKQKLISTLMALGAIFLLALPATAMQTAPTEDQDNTEINTVSESEDSSADETAITALEDSGLEQEQVTYYSTLFQAGESLYLSDHYLSDVIVAGQTITISPDAIIEGDLIVAAETINISGAINGDVRAAASTINLNQAKITKNASLFAAQIITDSGTYFSQDLSAFCGSLILNSPVARDLWAGAGEITLNNNIGGNSYLQESGLITLGSQAQLNGDLNYTSEKEAIITSGATVKGAINYTPVEKNEKNHKPLLNVGKIFWEIIKIFSLLLIGVVLIYLFPDKFKDTTKTMFQDPGPSFGWGLIFLCLTPLVCVILIFTLIGLPLAILGFIGYALALYLAPLVLGLALGQKILTNTENLFWPMVLGTLIFCLIRLIPWVGGILALAGVVWALGAYIVSCRQHQKIKGGKSKKSNKK